MENDRVIEENDRQEIENLWRKKILNVFAIRSSGGVYNGERWEPRASDIFETGADMIALTREGNKILEGIMKNIDDAEQKRAQADRAVQARRSRMEYEMEHTAKTRDMRSLDISTGYEVQNARFDWVKKSPLFSHEQKMYAAIDADTAEKQKTIQDRMNSLRTEMVDTGEKMGMTEEEKATPDKKYTDKHQENYKQAKAA